MRLLSRRNRFTIRWLDVQSGDVVVVKTTEWLSAADRHAVVEHVESLLPDGARCLLLDPNLDISVVLAAVERRPWPVGAEAE